MRSDHNLDLLEMVLSMMSAGYTLDMEPSPLASPLSSNQWAREFLLRDCSATCEALQCEHKRARYGIISARKNEGTAQKACIRDGGADV